MYPIRAVRRFENRDARAPDNGRLEFFPNPVHTAVVVQEPPNDVDQTAGDPERGGTEETRRGAVSRAPATGLGPAGLWPRWVVLGVGVVAWGLLAWAVLFLLGAVTFVLQGVLVPVAVAMFLAYLLDPLVDRIERWHWNRSAAIVLLLGGFFVGFGLLMLVAVPIVMRDVRAFADTLPQNLVGVSRQLEWGLTQLGFDHIPTSINDLVRQVESQGSDARQWAEWGATPLLEVVKTLIGGTASLLQALVSALLIPVLTFYLLYDFDNMIAGARDLTPSHSRPWIVSVMREVDVVLGQFMRGQLTVMVILAVLYAVGYWLAGVRMALLIGVVAGLVSFIPYLGSALALVLALLVVALDSQDWVQAAAVVAIYSVIQTVEGFYITPKVVGDKVGLSAIWVLLALMVGGELFGFLGVLLALPVAAVLKVFVGRAIAAYRGSRWYQVEGDVEAP